MKSIEVKASSIEQAAEIGLKELRISRWGKKALDITVIKKPGFTKGVYSIKRSQEYLAFLEEEQKQFLNKQEEQKERNRGILLATEE